MYTWIRREGKTYGSRGHLGQRMWLQFWHCVDLPSKRVSHLWQVRRTRCTGLLRTKAFPVAREGIVRTIGPAGSFSFPLFSDNLDFFDGYLGHFLHRVCLQFLHIFSDPNVTWQRWHSRWTRKRIFFSTRCASARNGGVQSAGSSLRPYFAKRLRAFSSIRALLSAAVVASRWLPIILMMGFVSLIACCNASCTVGSGDSAAAAATGLSSGTTAKAARGPAGGEAAWGGAAGEEAACKGAGGAAASMGVCFGLNEVKLVREEDEIVFRLQRTC